MCSREAHECRLLPDPTEAPRSWFAMVDFSSSGDLSKKDVAEALRAQLPINSDELDRRFDELWGRWDANGDGDLSLDELFRPKDGLLEYLRLAKGLCAPPPVPDITKDKAGWFAHFDLSHTGQLSAAELCTGVNALATQRAADAAAATSEEALLTAAAAAAAATTIVDTDTVAMLLLSCELRSEGHVDLDEFTRAGGIADVLIASLGL